MTKSQRIRELLNDGLPAMEIAKRVKVSKHFVYQVSFRARHPEYARNWDEQRRRAKGVPPQSTYNRDRKVAKDKRADPIVAAVRAGNTYSEVAAMFGLKSRNVVAGIVSRQNHSSA